MISETSVYRGTIGVRTKAKDCQIGQTFTEDTALRCWVISTRRLNTQAGRIMDSEAQKMMPMLFVHLSMMSRATRPVVAENSRVEMVPITAPIMIAAVLRSRLNLSLTAETTTSIREIREVRPAINRETKNRIPKTSPKGISLMIVGKATKARPMPPLTTSETLVCVW